MKNLTFRGWGWWKTYIEGGLPQKRACTVFWFKEGAWQERRGMFLRGFDPLMDTMIQKIKFLKLNYIHLGSLRACLFNKLISNFLSLLLLNWLRGDLQHIGHMGEKKNQVWTNQNLRNNWYLIARQTVC